MIWNNFGKLLYFSFGSWLLLNNFLVKSAKLRALRAKNMLTCQCTLLAYVLTCLTCSRAHVPTCLACLRAHVRMCVACLRAHVPTCLACLRAHVQACFACSLAHVPMCLECLSASLVNMPCVLMYSCVNMACERTCSHALNRLPHTACVTTLSPANTISSSVSSSDLLTSSFCWSCTHC